MLDLFEASIRVRRRDTREEPEPAGIVLHQTGGIFVEAAGKAAGLLDVVSVPDAGLDDGEYRRRDSAPVHLSSDRAGDHCGGAGPMRRPGIIMASTWNGGRKW